MPACLPRMTIFTSSPVSYPRILTFWMLINYAIKRCHKNNEALLIIYNLISQTRWLIVTIDIGGWSHCGMMLVLYLATWSISWRGHRHLSFMKMICNVMTPFHVVQAVLLEVAPIIRHICYVGVSCFVIMQNRISTNNLNMFLNHDDVIKWKHIPRYWHFVRGIHRSPVNSPHKGQWRGALMFSLICAWINEWVNNGEACDLRRHRAHYDVTVMWWLNSIAYWKLHTGY